MNINYPIYEYSQISGLFERMKFVSETSGMIFKGRRKGYDEDLGS